MNSLQLSLPVRGNRPAVLTLAQPPTLEALARLEQALAGTLGLWRRDLGDRASHDGAIEYASWTPYLRPAGP